MNGIDSYATWKGWSSKSFGELPPHVAAYYRRELAEALPAPGARVLELGFGNGSFLAFAKKSGYLVDGVELNQRQMEKARCSGFSALRPDEVTGSYSLIVAFDVLEHLNHAELAAMLDRIFELLPPGGHFVARFPNGQSPFGLVNQNGDMDHKTSIGAEMIRQLAIAHGFEILDIRNQRAWLHSNPIIAALRLLQRALGKLFEVVISVAFFNRIEPMFPNLVVHLRKPLQGT